MKEDRKLDLLVAEKIMGWVLESKYVHRWTSPVGTRSDDSDIPNYSTSLNATWEVVEKLFLDSWAVKIEGSEYFGKIQDEQAGGFDVTFSCKVGARGRFSAWAETLPEAICLAALKTV